MEPAGGRPHTGRPMSLVTDLVRRHESGVRPLFVEANRAWVDAAVTGTDAAFARSEAAQNALDRELSDRAVFAEAKRLRDSGEVRDPLERRLVEVVWLARLGKQVPEEILRRITEKSVAVEKAFNTFRAETDGRRFSENEVREVLRKSADSGFRRRVWEASKRVGALVEPDLKELVRLRNEAARSLGFSDHYALALAVDEHDERELFLLLDRIDGLTRDAFARAKAEADAVLARRYGIAGKELRPWHYEDPFFQEAPEVFGVDLDAPYAGKDVVAIAREFFAGVGLPVEDVLARSDLYEKPGKTPHAFCTNVDRENDVRVICNVVPSERWMETTLHELGHAVYEKHFAPGTPWTLRAPSHTLTTEAIAMLFGRLPKSGRWMKEALALGEGEAARFGEPARQALRLRQLVFSRWVQVMTRFERELYRAPSRDLNALWWDLVERYQGVTRPEGRSAPDYASKIHIVAAPVYYHNYLLGEVFASQLHAALDAEKKGYSGRREVGEFLRERVFAPAATLRWDALCRHATGSPLSPDAFAREYV